MLFPVSRLIHVRARALAFAGPHIRLLDPASGDLHASAVLAAPVRCTAVDHTGSLLATCGDDKLLSVWRIDGLELLNQRELPKRPTAIEFTKDPQAIVVSDKFGDVFSYPLEYTPLSEKQKRDALSSHENPSGGTLLLGHTSVLTSLLFSQDERYIITADRDEHIRVSWYPQGYVVEMYCLGHEKYVSAIHIPSSSPATLVSGGGDPMLKVWDWMSGALQYDIPVLDAVRPFIVVTAKPKRGDDEQDEDSKSRGKKRKGKKKVDEGDAPQPPPRHVLVIHRIATVLHARESHLIFSAVGATALFACPLKPDAVVQSFDVQKPVLDFSISDDGFIWVLLDGNWTSPGEEGPTTNMIRVLHLTPSGGELAEVSSGPHIALLISLNSTCLLPATPEDIKQLDLYTDLTWLPKHNEGIDIESKSDRAPSEGPGENEEEQLTKRELGRLKNKRRVLEKAQAAAEKALEEKPATKRTKDDQR